VIAAPQGADNAGSETMYAVIKTGGKQYRVSAGDVLAVEKLEAEPGSLVTFAEVLMLGGEAGATVGRPTVAGASVTAEVLEQSRGPKLIIFKKRRRKNSRNKKGHRQDLTTVRVLEVLAAGATSSAKPSDEGKRRAMAQHIARTPFAPLAEPIGAADDLTRLTSIDEDGAKKLNEAGIFHYWQMARLGRTDHARLMRKHGEGLQFVREVVMDDARRLALGYETRDAMRRRKEGASEPAESENGGDEADKSPTA
jgi:large subunit ribosomal protein L21